MDEHARMPRQIEHILGKNTCHVLCDSITMQGSENGGSDARVIALIAKLNNWCFHVFPATKQWCMQGVECTHPARSCILSSPYEMTK